jgi:hypothetical protein
LLAFPRPSPVMPFPRQTDGLALPLPSSFGNISRSVLEMGAITGVVIRLGRSLFLAGDAPPNLAYLGVVYVLGAVFMMGMAALHLSNYTVRRWLWRAPAFTLVEVAAEVLTSLLLIAVGREQMGTGNATLHDWTTLAGTALFWRAVLLISFSILLAAIVQVIRTLMAGGRTLELDEPLEGEPARE